MHLERWRDLQEQIREGFAVEEDDSYFLEEEQGGTMVEYMVFDGPIGLMRLEFIIKPKVLGKKAIYSNRIGSESVVEYDYSPTEKCYELLAYRWNETEDDWQPFENNLFN